MNKARKSGVCSRFNLLNLLSEINTKVTVTLATRFKSGKVIFFIIYSRGKRGILVVQLVGLGFCHPPFVRNKATE